MPSDDRGMILWDAVRWYRVPLLFGVFSLLCLFLSITIFIKAYQDASPIQFSSDRTEGEQKQGKVIVDVRGAVNTPGVYELPEGSRIEDALVKAGGLLSDVDTTRMEQSINRAAKVVDGAKIYIPRKNENAEPIETGVTRAGAVVNINTASSRELETLPGIGPILAGKIIEGRPYQKLEELVEHGIVGQSIFSKIKDTLSL